MADREGNEGVNDSLCTQVIGLLRGVIYDQSPVITDVGLTGIEGHLATQSHYPLSLCWASLTIS